MRNAERTVLRSRPGASQAGRTFFWSSAFRIPRSAFEAHSTFRTPHLAFSPCEPTSLPVPPPSFRRAAACGGARGPLRARAGGRGSPGGLFLYHQSPHLREGGGRVAAAPAAPHGLRDRAPGGGGAHRHGAAQGEAGAAPGGGDRGGAEGGGRWGR